VQLIPQSFFCISVYSVLSWICYQQSYSAQENIKRPQHTAFSAYTVH